MNAPVFTFVFKGPPDNFDDMRDLVRSAVISLSKLGVAIRPDDSGLLVLSSFDVELHLKRHATRMTMPLGVVELHLHGLGFERVGAAESGRFAIESEAFQALHSAASNFHMVV
jgi:hypothetical protein